MQLSSTFNVTRYYYIMILDVIRYYYVMLLDVIRYYYVTLLDVIRYYYVMLLDVILSRTYQKWVNLKSVVGKETSLKLFVLRI